MMGFSQGGDVNLAQLQATMQAIEQACSSIQMHMNPAAAEANILAFRQSARPYQSCQFILENSQLANARFQAAATIRDAAIREWVFLSAEEKRSLITYCLCFVMEHAYSSDSYVQAKLSSVGAQLMKRNWLDSTAAEKEVFFLEVKQAVLGGHGVDVQFAGINFLESLVSEFTPATSTAMGLPADFHEQCRASLELDHLMNFYQWALDAALSVTNKVVELTASPSEVKVCSAALRHMVQILNWNFQSDVAGGAKKSAHDFASGFGRNSMLPKKSDLILVQPGPKWRDVLLSHGHLSWLLELYGRVRQKVANDGSWIDSPFAVSARQLIVQLCSLTGSVFPSGFFLNPRFHYQEDFVYIDHIRSGVTKVIERLAPDVTFAIEATRELAQFRGKIGRFGDLTTQTTVGIMNPDNGQTQEKHMVQMLSGIIQWVDPPEAVSVAIKCGKSESEMLDGCRALLSMATLTTLVAFDNLLKSIGSFGTLSLLSALTCEVIKANASNDSEEETWTSEALDILLDTWNVLLEPTGVSKNAPSPVGINAAASVFRTILESELKAAGDSAFDDSNDSEQFQASISARDEMLSSYAVIARAAANMTIPLLVELFSERCSLLHQVRGRTDPTHTLEELHWLLLISGHVLADSGEGETPLVPEALHVQFLDIVDGEQHPVVILSRSIVRFAEQSLDSDMRVAFFSPRVMEIAQFRGKIGRFGDLTAQTAVGIMNPGYFLNLRFHYQEGFEYSDQIRLGVTKVIERLAPNVTFAIEATREAVIWFLARWADTYLMPLAPGKGYSSAPGQQAENLYEKQLLRNAVNSAFGENNQGKTVLDTIIRVSMMALVAWPGEKYLQELTCFQLLPTLVRRRNICVQLVALDSWRNLANAFAYERSLFSLASPLQRSLAETLSRSASGMSNSEASKQFVRDLMGPVTTYVVDISTKSDLKVFSQQPDAILTVSCLLERLRGAARGTEPRTQKAIFDMGVAVMKPLLILLETYKNESAVIYMLLKFVVDWVDGQVVFLEPKDTTVLVNFCIQLLQIYSSHNIGKISLSLSSSLLSEAKSEKYKDLRALLQLLTNLCSKDLVDFSSGSDEAESPDIAQIVYLGLHIITPLISLELLKYPKLCHQYFALLSHMLEVYPEKVARLNTEAFAHIIGTLDFGIHHQDIEVISMCMGALNALASFHYREKNLGKEGLGVHAASFENPNGKLHEGILDRFLQSLLQLLLFEDYSTELVGSAADALLPLILCNPGLYQRLGHELMEKQENPTLRSRLASALESLTTSNQLTSSLDRANYQKFRKNLHHFLIEVRGFLRTI